MRRAAVESWRFAEDLGQITHAVLYVRDALGLPVEPAPGTPPRLAGEVPDRSDILEGTARDHAGPHWARWWRSLIAQEARMHLGPDGDRGQWMRSVHSELLQVIDPPEWASLAGQPELRSAAQALFTEGCAWADAARRSLLPPAHDPFFDWRLTRDMAEVVAAEAGARIGAINGCVLVLLVQGRWWELVSPGVALCSQMAAEDRATAAAVLHSVFSSALGSAA